MGDGGYTLFQNLEDKLPEIPEKSVVSRTLLDTDDLKATLFGFAAGQEMTEHTAAYPAVIQVLTGEAVMALGEDEHEIGPGAWIHMPARLPHSLMAKDRFVFLLLLLK